jgi:zinc/manganese transport system permease protein
MLGQEYMRNALLAGGFIALACGVCGWFVVLRGQLFAGDALSHVAFPGALAAAAAGIDERIGLFAATIAAGVAIALLGRGALAARGARAAGAAPADDADIGVLFTVVLALGVFFLTRFSLGSGGSAGIQAAHTLFGSIFGLGAGEAALAAIIAAATLVAMAAIGRPLLFASVAPELAGARGVPTRLLSVAFMALLGVMAAEATQAVGALLLLGLLAGPAGAAQRLRAGTATGAALAAALALAAMWGGLVLAYEIPSLPPSTAVIGLCTVAFAVPAALARRAGGAHR